MGAFAHETIDCTFMQLHVITFYLHLSRYGVWNEEIQLSSYVKTTLTTFAQRFPDFQSNYGLQHLNCPTASVAH